MHWVSEHTVTRSSRRWGSGTRYSRPPRRSQPVRRRTRPAPPPPKPYSSRWADPNARCPVCGAAVYFYANEHGSRVYFDEMGPPWPKHPCTLSPTATQSVASNRPGRAGPSTYPFEVGRRIRAGADSLSRRNRYATAATFRGRYGRAPVDAWLVLGTWLVEQGTILHLHRAYEWSEPVAWVTPERINVPVGTLVFIHGDQLSFVDMVNLEIVTVPVSYSHRLPKKPLLERLRARMKGNPLL